MRRLPLCLLLSALGACGARPAGPHGKNPAPIVAEADRLLARSFELDYAAPAKPTRRDARRAALALYVEACELGDRRACWLGVTYTEALDESHGRLARAVVASCRAGDVTSCRVLHSSRERVFRDADFAAEACAQGVGAACPRGWNQDMTDADERALHHRGCELGDAVSCSALDGDDPVSARTTAAFHRECAAGYPDSCVLDDEIERGQALAEAGCAEGLVDECSLAASGARDPVVRAKALGRACRQLGLRCGDLAFMHRPPHKTLPGALPDPAAERDAYEHACQRDGADHFCHDLATLYELREIPEPYPGRGQEVDAYLCSLPPGKYRCRKE